MKIIFIGASGMLGKPVARELINAGHEVTLLARDPDRLENLFPGARIVRGDVFDRKSLVNAFDKSEAVYLNLSVLPTSKEKDLQPEREGVQNILEAARENKLRRIAYLSSMIKNYEGMNGFHWWAFRIKEEAVDVIRSSGISYSIFYPSTFMETFPYQLLRGNKLMLLGNSIAPMWFIAAEDYARQVTRSFEIAGNQNKEYNIQGAESLTFDEAAKVFAENFTKKKIKVIKFPIGPIRFFGKFSQQMNYGANICEALNNYPERFESEGTWRELGKPSTDLATFASSL